MHQPRECTETNARTMAQRTKTSPQWTPLPCRAPWSSGSDPEHVSESPRPWPHPRPAGSISPLDCGVWGTQTHSIERTFLPLISLARLVLIDWAGRPGFSDAVSCWEVIWYLHYLDSLGSFASFVSVDPSHVTEGICYWTRKIPWIPSYQHRIYNLIK